MKKKFEMENLDCANCAMKMEELIKKIEGVEDASVSFMLQRLTLTAEEEKFAEILPLAEKAIHKIDADCELIY